MRWQAQILGPPQDPIVIVDGKKVRHGGPEIVNAVDLQGRFLGSVLTESKSDEVPAARLLLRSQDLLGKIVLPDAKHTNQESAQQILFEGGGDYLMKIKALERRVLPSSHLCPTFFLASFLTLPNG